MPADPPGPGADRLRLVTVALWLVCVQAIAALAAGSRPGASAATVMAAAASLALLAPLAVAKRRLGRRLGSRARAGDGALSSIGAATSLLALTALALYHALGWWWADRAAALVVAAVAAGQAWLTLLWQRGFARTVARRSSWPDASDHGRA
jgi:divalent metal cation (Fe/Co/Zn/Cd) transporter